MINDDPKHGRWILPLIIVAMVVLTYTFVNGIEPAESPTGSVDQNEDPPFPTTPTSSTTTLPQDIEAFMVTLDIFENQLQAFASQLETINTQWESGETEFSPTRDAFLDLKASLEQWENNVAQVDGVPSGLTQGHVELVIEVEDLAPKMDDVVIGLDAPDDGTLRRAAVAEFRAEVEDVADAIEAIRQQATTGATSDTTEGDDGTTSSTEPATEA